MLDASPGLTESDLTAIAELETRTTAVDGGRLKLEWDTLRSRPADQVQDLLWWDDGRLVGFLGLYQFGGALELTGMVDPSWRRRGIATALLDAARSLWAGQHPVLLVTPRDPCAGGAFALARGGVVHHSEHALVLRTDPPPGPDTVGLREATSLDADAVRALLLDGFGYVPGDVLARGADRVIVAEQDGRVVATVRLTRDRDRGGIYGFVVHPDRRGLGIGREVLRRACGMLRDDGATSIGLDVAVDNDRALGLYLRSGFSRLTTEDYYLLPLG